MAGIRVTELDHVVLRVVDLEESMAFYRDLLGLPIEGLEEYRKGTRPFVSARIGAQLIDLFPDPNYDREIGSREGGLFHLCVRVSGDLAADVLPRVREFGAEVLEAAPASRFGATGYAPSIYIRDPDAHIVELREEAE
jgi:catechol 2,3-dioxygenase-like lactoylglutathione lyase family enzyme